MKRSLLGILICVGLIGQPLRAESENELLWETMSAVFEIILSSTDYRWEELSKELMAWTEALEAAGYTEEAADIWPLTQLAAQSNDVCIRKEWYAALYAKHPTYLNLRNALAWTTLIQQGDAEEALKLLRGDKARGIAEWDTLAWVQFKAGRKVDAMQTVLFALRFAQESESHHPVLYDHAGDILYANGHILEAYRCWREGEQLAQQLIAQGETSDEQLWGNDNYRREHSRKKRAAAKKLHPEVFAE